MDTLQKEVFICDRCTNEVHSGDEFCSNCGAIFPGNIQFCWNHSKTEASGICIICQKPYCLGCAQNINGIYLCNEHLSYEIFECMARVYAVNDQTMADYVTEFLTKSGLHPCVFNKKISPAQFEVPNHPFFYPEDAHLMNEFKVMVPCTEVLNAENALKDLHLLPQRK